MGKYSALTKYLIESNSDEVVLTFAEIEEILFDSLPKSAFATDGWWTNNSKTSQAAGWIHAGYRVRNCYDDTIITEKMVTFFKLKEPMHNSDKADGNSILCERCGQHMLLRTNRESGSMFWGCSAYPKCRNSKTYDEDSTAKNNQQVPGFVQGATQNDSRTRSEIYTVVDGAKPSLEQILSRVEELTKTVKILSDAVEGFECKFEDLDEALSDVNCELANLNNRFDCVYDSDE